MPLQNELIMLQALPLDLKIEKSKARIREWVYEYGKDGVYVSFSGGKDSIVLLDLVRSEFPDIIAVFCDTGLEYPEVKQIVSKTINVIILKPKMTFKDVVEKYGYPIISKDQSSYIYEYNHSKSEKFKKYRLEGDSKGRFKISEKWKYLLNAPFKISSKCCDILKKNPFKAFEKSSGKVPILGTMAYESMLRKKEYLKYGCNSFDTKRPKSTPLGFWKENDILQYIINKNLEIPSVYGEIVMNENGDYKTTGNERTGCMFCMFGCHLHKENNFQRMKQTHPKIYEYCIREENGLGLGKVLDYINVKY
jgi:3'-phosphoadenosine 5'-phosphosulfate sulfotransferase (PAPS reductase)/FAD synthetase